MRSSADVVRIFQVYLMGISGDQEVGDVGFTCIICPRRHWHSRSGAAVGINGNAQCEEIQYKDQKYIGLRGGRTGATRLIRRLVTTRCVPASRLRDWTRRTRRTRSDFIFLPVSLKVCTLALRLGHATGNRERAPRTGGAGTWNEVTLPSTPLVLSNIVLFKFLGNIQVLHNLFLPALS